MHLKKYRDFPAKQSYKTWLHNRNPSPIDYWITMIMSTFASWTSLSSSFNHEKTTTDKFYKACTTLADWGLRFIFIKILGLNKKGSNPSVKMVMKRSTHAYITQTHPHWLPHHNKHQYSRNIYWNHQRTYHQWNFKKLASNGVGQCKITKIHKCI